MTRPNTEPPVEPEDRLAYAVSLLRGAGAVGAAGQEPRRRLVQPFFLLICFSLENALKAYLQHCGVHLREKIDRPPIAHDLRRLKDLAVGSGLSLPEKSAELIDSLSDYHLEHQFRYPKNAGTVEIFSDAFAYGWTDEALASVARGINYQPPPMLGRPLGQAGSL
jgi:hypothetical protein